MSSRSLTAEEIALAQSAFGNTIDYSKVKIYNEKHNWFQGNSTVVTPDGNIYYPSDSYFLYGTNIATRADANALAAKALFLHEMTHVWQEQFFASSGDFIRHAIKDRSYDYSDIFDSKAYAELNAEQQAQFIQDLYLLQNGVTSINGKNLADLSGVLPSDWKTASYPAVEGGIHVQEQYNGDRGVNFYRGGAESVAAAFK